MDLSHPTNSIICSGNWKSHIDQFNRTTFLILLAVAILLSLVYAYVSWGNRKAKECSLQTTKSTNIPKFRLFHFFEIPILEGFYTLYRIREDGCNAAIKWASIIEENIGVDLYLGPIKFIALTEASACQKVLNSSDPGHLSKPQQLYGRIFNNWLQKGLLNADYDLWKVDRKIMARSFTFGALESDLKSKNNHGKKLASCWKELSNNNEGIVQGKDLYDTLSTTLIRTIIEFIIGTEQCSTEDISKFRDDFCKWKDITSYRTLHPELYIAPIWWLHPKKRKLDNVVKSIHTFVIQVIKRYEKKILMNSNKDADKAEKQTHSYAEERCLVESMLYHGASSEQIYFEVVTILLAGHETTETALSFLLLDLALNLHHQAKCREEVDSLFESKSLDSDFDLDLNMEDLSELKYLERCIMESLRLTPTVPAFMRKIDTPLRINGDTVIEGGSYVLISPWLPHKDPKYYPNPKKFDPDRFLPENVKKREPGSYIPFSGGPRKCIGWKAAIHQIKVIMTWILRNFEIFSEDKRADVKLIFNITTKPERHYNLILKRRM